MNRTLGYALVATATGLAWLLGVALAQTGGNPPQDPLAGARVFSGKGCAACHMLMKVAPDLRQIASPRSLDNLVSALWNHQQHAQRSVRTSRLNAREAGDLIAFLFALKYFEAEGDSQTGERLFTDKKCVICHQVGGAGGVLGPSLDHFRRQGSPMMVAAAMWNHGRQTAQEMGATGIERPRLEGIDVRNLVAYLNRASSATLVGPLHLFPGNAELGRAVFVERCIECHGVGSSGVDLAGRRTRRNLIDFAAIVWNKAPAMMAMMKKRDIDIDITPLRADQMADLVAYLDSIAYFAGPGSVERGEKLATAKGCRACHSGPGPGVSLSGYVPRSEHPGSPPAVVALAWNHSLIVASAARRVKASWRPLAAEEVADLMAFVRAPTTTPTSPGTTPEAIQTP